MNVFVRFYCDFLDIHQAGMDFWCHRYSVNVQYYALKGNYRIMVHVKTYCNSSTSTGKS